MIIETTSGRAIALMKDGLCLHGIDEGQTTNNRWLCVSKNGYYGLQDPKSGRYIGHDGNIGMRASAMEHRGWELITPREHPHGGYQLVVPQWWYALRTVVVAEDGRSLLARQHGETLGKFVRV
jgi:hypothetical protein